MGEFSPQRQKFLDIAHGVIAKCLEIEARGCVMLTHKADEIGFAAVALAKAPDGIQIRGVIAQILQEDVSRPIIHSRKEKALTAFSLVAVRQNQEACKMGEVIAG